jgi:hypothetical protein
LATLSLGDINAGTCSSRLGVGCKTHDLALRKFVMKSEEVKTRYNLAESSKEEYGPKRTVFPMTRPKVIEGTWRGKMFLLYYISIYEGKSKSNEPYCEKNLLVYCVPIHTVHTHIRSSSIQT